MKENIRIGITQAVASLLGLLALVFTALPAYWEEGNGTLTMLELVFGNTRTPANGVLIFALLLLILGILASLVLTVFAFLNRFFREKTVTVLAVCSGVLVLVGVVLLSVALFLTGLDKVNSELGFTQGNWGLGIGNILIPVFGLLAVGFTYPAAMIIPHHRDLADKEGKTEAMKASQ
jgi:hypothetical protein